MKAWALLLITLVKACYIVFVALNFLHLRTGGHPGGDPAKCAHTRTNSHIRSLLKLHSTLRASVQQSVAIEYNTSILSCVENKVGWTYRLGICHCEFTKLAKANSRMKDATFKPNSILSPVPMLYEYVPKGNLGQNDCM